MKRISKECKYFKNCPLKENGVQPCVTEFKAVYGKIPKKGAIIWSTELCYALIGLIKDGLVKVKG